MSITQLPIAALRLAPATATLLYQLGIEQIGQLLELDPADLPGRFGPQVVQRLDQLLGRVPELAVPYRPPPEVQAHQAFEYGVERLDLLHDVVDRLAESIQTQLQKRGRGARQLECCLHYERLEPLRLAVGLFRSSDAAAHLSLLVRTQLERVELAAPVCAMSLRVSVVEAIAERHAELFETDRDYSQELATLLDRLSQRLGREAVARPVIVPDAQPECAFRFEPVLTRKRATGLVPVGQAKPTGKSPVARRPLCLGRWPMAIEVRANLRGQPAAFTWRGVEHHVVRTWGPERIATGWWRGRDVERDYYVVATEDGARWWVFQAGERWFVHGHFA